MVSSPKIAQRGPFATQVVAGKSYAWCACGHSAKQPLCDGSHAGTGYVPIVFKAQEDKTLYLCGCKHSRNGQYCDGTHSSLPE